MNDSWWIRPQNEGVQAVKEALILQDREGLELLGSEGRSGPREPFVTDQV